MRVRVGLTLTLTLNSNPHPHPNPKPSQVRGARAPPADPVHGGGVPEEGPRPLLATGDDADLALSAAYAAALSAGGRQLLLGGTGQKCLAVAEGRADVAVTDPSPYPGPSPSPTNPGPSGSPSPSPTYPRASPSPSPGPANPQTGAVTR